MEQILGIDQDDIVRCSGKAGIGIDELIEAIIRRVPPPAAIPAKPLQANGVRFAL